MLFVVACVVVCEQHLRDNVHGAVVGCRLDAEHVTHEAVDVDVAEGVHLEVLLEGRTVRHEYGKHGRLVVVVAVIAVFVRILLFEYSLSRVERS